jgi:tetratricopeptide (TPR) repeat protein
MDPDDRPTVRRIMSDMRAFGGHVLKTLSMNARMGARWKTRHEKPERLARSNVPLAKGELIGGEYEVLDTLGEGGCGVVYLVQVRHTRQTLALKTIRDELLDHPGALEAFKKEALLWVNLERHPFILSAEWVDEVSGRLFVVMEYIARDAQGRVSLADYLAPAGKPIEPSQALKWAIQFCLGMEHARAHGIECHRDIKPQNILITHDGTLRISDLGLATAAEEAWRGSSRWERGSFVTRGAEGGFGFSLMLTEGKRWCGTPGYVAPEVYRGEESDVRSDIFSFGLVLWQIATGSRVPPFWIAGPGEEESRMRTIYEQQMAGRFPPVKHLLFSPIEGCLRPIPAERFGNFQELRKILERLWVLVTGKSFDVPVPEIGRWTSGVWSNKGAAFKALGRHEEAVSCYDKALTIDPRNAAAWGNKGISLTALGRHEQAINCYDKALAIDPRNANAWCNKGATLDDLDRHQEAIDCYDRALAIDPKSALAWDNKGVAHRALGDLNSWTGGSGNFEEALRCFDKALAIDPQNASAWNGKGSVHRALGRERSDTAAYVAALVCFDKALAINPRYVPALGNKADTLDVMGLHEDAIDCCENALAVDPRNADMWYTKALAEDAMSKWCEAMSSYQKFIELALPQYAQQIAHARQRLHELESKGI